MHLPDSPGLQNDDRRIQSLNGFIGREIVVTEKMDGENTTMYGDHLHARSLDSRHHQSRDWVKKFWGTLNYLIPEDWRICGENVYAQHSITYDSLESYFYGFSIWDANNVALSWDDTVYYFEEVFHIEPVPVLYRGKFDLNVLKDLAESLDPLTQEGFVVRVTDIILFDEFDQKVVKWVRKGHVQCSDHWMSQAVVPNTLRV
jgi:hypothetical protein